MLNPQSPMPLYHQLAEILLEKIRTGEYAPGAKIPSEPALAAAYGIGRPTARQAIELLVRRRFLTRKRGAGTFVRAEREEVDLFSLAGTTSAFQKKGISVTGRILEKPHLKEIDADPENPFHGARAFFVSRLSLVDNVPVLLEEILLDPEWFTGIDKIDLTDRSISQVVDERYHMRPVGAKQNFRIGYVSGTRAQHLDVSPSTPILLVKRFLSFPLADNIVYSDLYCRTDQFVFSQIIGGLSVD
jgi:GntR family transcriptional regulator